MLFICFFLIHCSQQNQRSGVPPIRRDNQGNPVDRNNVNQSRRWSGSLEISNANVYHDFLQGNGVCDVYTWNVGNAKCEKWDATADVELIFEKNSLPSPVELRITPRLDTSSNPYFQSPQIIAVKGEANHAGDNYGFQAHLSQYSARSGSVGSGFSVIIESEEGTPEERIINMDIFYGGRAHQDVRIGALSLENPSKPVSLNDEQLIPGR